MDITVVSNPSYLISSKEKLIQKGIYFYFTAFKEISFANQQLLHSLFQHKFLISILLTRLGKFGTTLMSFTSGGGIYFC
jgi:hypothetical protein